MDSLTRLIRDTEAQLLLSDARVDELKISLEAERRQNGNLQQFAARLAELRAARTEAED